MVFLRMEQGWVRNKRKAEVARGGREGEKVDTGMLLNPQRPAVPVEMGRGL